MSSKKKKAKKELSEAVDSEVLETEAVDTKKKKKKAKKEKTPMDLDSKKTLFKSFTALVCVIAVCITAVVNTGKMCDAAKKAAEQRGSAATEAMGDDAAVDGEVPSDDAVVDEVPTDASGEEVPTDAAPADDASAGTAGTDTSLSTGTATSGNKTTASASSGIPTGVAQIVSYYNTATAKVASKKAPFSKTRSTVEKSYDAGFALKQFKSKVFEFMGVGDANKFTKSVTSADADSYHKYFQASKLTASDVTKATCTKSGNNYTITLNIKNGSSSVKDGKVVSSNNSPLDRSGLACGDKDKNYWDHKTAENVMSAISAVPGCGSATISESYSNAVITAVVNASTGNLVSLNAKFDFKFALSNVVGTSATAVASSTVSMTGFKM